MQIEKAAGECKRLFVGLQNAYELWHCESWGPINGADPSGAASAHPHDGSRTKLSAGVDCCLYVCAFETSRVRSVLSLIVICVTGAIPCNCTAGVLRLYRTGKALARYHRHRQFGRRPNPNGSCHSNLAIGGLIPREGICWTHASKDHMIDLLKPSHVNDWVAILCCS